MRRPAVPVMRIWPRGPACAGGSWSQELVVPAPVDPDIFIICLYPLRIARGPSAHGPGARGPGDSYNGAEFVGQDSAAGHNWREYCIAVSFNVVRTREAFPSELPV